MPQLPQGFDTDNYQGDGGFEPMPIGVYDAIIIDSIEKPTNAGDSNYLQLTLEIVGEKYSGRLLFEILCIYHAKQQVRQIAFTKLANYCRACGLPNARTTEELHNIPLKVSLGIKDQGEQYGKKNIIKKVMPANAQPQAQQQKQEDKPVWARG